MFKDFSDMWINPVNCVGVMGAGMASRFRSLYPKMYAEYRDLCSRSHLRPGKLHVWPTHQRAPRWIVNFPTKDHFKDASRIVWIEQGLAALRRAVIDLEPRTVSIPALGCGLGGLAWDDVKQRIAESLGDIDGVEFLLYAPVPRTLHK